MIEAVVQHGDQRQRGEGMHLVGGKNQRQTQCDDQEPDIFDGRVGEQAFHVSLHGGKYGAEHGRQQSQRQCHHAPPP